MHRDDYLRLTPDELLRACTIKGFQGSGPGGQHRNKTNTGVCLRLATYNLEIKSSESRSSLENKTHALRRMRMALALKVREAPKNPDFLRFPGSNGRIQPSNRDFPQFIADVLDIAQEYGGDTKPAAAAFGITHSALVRILHQEKSILEALQAIRSARRKPSNIKDV